MIRIYCIAHDRADCGPCAKSGRLKPKQAIRPRDRRRMQDGARAIATDIDDARTDAAWSAMDARDPDDVCDDPSCPCHSDVM